MQPPPPQASPYDLVDPAGPNPEIEGVKVAWYAWRTLVGDPLTEAIDTFRFFTDPDLL